MINLRENIWAVEVPDKIANPHLYRVNNSSIMLKWDDIERPLNPHDLVKVDTYYGNLDDYKWPEIVCTSKEATEDECAIIAGLSFQDVVHGYSRTFFHDLLTEKGCDINKNYLILKKQ